MECVDSRYYVWCMSENISYKVHDSVEAATIEAKRLAELNKGSAFTVVRAICEVTYRTDPFQIRNFATKR